MTEKAAQFYDHPPNYAGIIRKIYDIKGEGLGRVKAYTIGRSILGRGLFALTLGQIRGSTLFVGGVRGQEWFTTLLMLRFFEDLLVSLRKGRPMAGIDVARAMQGRSLTIVPCLNPDGVEIALNQDHGALHFQNEVRKISGGHYENWQANGRGVDLQYNFDAGWQAARRLQAEAGICGPAPAGFSGNSPMSEPESRAAVNLCKTFDVAKLFTFHTPGEEIRYSYGENTPIRSRLMVEVLAGACGYAVREPGNSDIPASMKDWFIHQTGRPAFAVHAGRESGLPAAGDLPLVYARLAEMMLLAVFI